MRLTLSILLLMLAFSGCSPRPATPRSLGEPRFVRLYADKLVLEEEARLRSLDSNAITHRLDSLYLAYSVTQAEAMKATEYYQSDLGRWSRLQELVGKRLEELSQQASSAPPL